MNTDLHTVLHTVLNADLNPAPGADLRPDTDTGADPRAARRHVTPATLWQAAAGDRAAFRHLAGIFCDTAPAYLAALQLAHAQADTAGVMRACHTLLGMSTLLGADTLAELLRALARQADTPLPPGAIEPLAALLPDVVAEVRQHALHYHGPDAA